MKRARALGNQRCAESLRGAGLAPFPKRGHLMRGRMQERLAGLAGKIAECVFHRESGRLVCVRPRREPSRFSEPVLRRRRARGLRRKAVPQWAVAADSVCPTCPSHSSDGVWRVDGRWQIERERTDKTHPNSLAAAQGGWNPVGRPLHALRAGSSARAHRRRKSCVRNVTCIARVSDRKCAKTLIRDANVPRQVPRSAC